MLVEAGVNVTVGVVNVTATKPVAEALLKIGALAASGVYVAISLSVPAANMPAAI
jgi:hypothetical protein